MLEYIKSLITFLAQASEIDMEIKLLWENKLVHITLFAQIVFPKF